MVSEQYIDSIMHGATIKVKNKNILVFRLHVYHICISVETS